MGRTGTFDPLLGTMTTAPDGIETALLKNAPRIICIRCGGRSNLQSALEQLLVSVGRLGGTTHASHVCAPTERYMTGKRGLVVGREDEIDSVVSILCCKTKTCAALVGAPGVGKTAIAEGLAQRIAAGKVPAGLAKARVVELDLGAMVAGTVLRGMFESRLKTVIKEAENSGGKIILFIDEMHMLIGAGNKWGSNDAANILKPALARGRIRCVGATTFDDYRKYIEKDAALERRFQKVHIEEPSTQATIAILRGIKQQYERHHCLEIQDAAIVAAAELAGRYITGSDVHFKGKNNHIRAPWSTYVILDT